MTSLIAISFLLPCLAQAGPGASTETLKLTMDQYVEMALSKGLASRQVKLDLQIAEMGRNTSLRQTYAPSLTANIGGTRSRLDDDDQMTYTDFGETGLSLSQPLPTDTQFRLAAKYSTTLTRTPDPANATHSMVRPNWSASVTQPLHIFVDNPALRSRKRTKLAFANAEDSHASSLLDIRSRAKALYYDVLLRASSALIDKRKLKSSETLLEVTRDLVAAGKLAPIETLRSRVRVERDRRRVTAALNDLRKSLQTAKDFVYLPIDKKVQFTSRLAYRPFTLSLERLTDFALGNRQELKRLKRAKELARLSVREAGEPNKPAINLTGNWDSTKTDLRAGTADSTDQTRSWTVGAALTWRFFDLFITRDQVKQARLAEEQAGIAYEQTYLATKLRVKNAFMDVKASEDQLLDFKAVRDSAMNNVEVVRIQFQHGKNRLLDVFDAENEARGIELEYLNLLVNYHSTQDSLAELVGTLLESL